MERHAIGAQALAHAGLRDLATEHGGPRPGGVRGDAIARAAPAAPDATATAEQRTREVAGEAEVQATRP